MDLKVRNTQIPITSQETKAPGQVSPSSKLAVPKEISLSAGLQEELARINQDFLKSISKYQDHKISDDMSNEEIQKTYSRIIDSWAEKYRLSSGFEKLLRFSAKFLDDDFNPRIYCALGNEFAEATKQTLKEMKLPTFIADPIYYGGWALALGVAGLRMCLRGLGQGTLKPFISTMGQDMISTIIGPTAVVNLANYLQNTIYKSIKLPQFVSMFLRPVLSLTAAKYSIPQLDHYLGVPLGKLATKVASDETWTKLGNGIGKKIEGMIAKKA